MPDSDAHYDVYTDFELLDVPDTAIASWNHIPSGPFWILGNRHGADRFYKRGRLESAIETFCREFLPLRDEVICYIMDSSGDVVLGAIQQDEQLERGFADWYGCQLAFDELEKSPLVDQAAVIYWKLLAQGVFCDE